MSDPQNNLHKLLPFNDDSHSSNLRWKGRIVVQIIRSCIQSAPVTKKSLIQF